MSVVFLRKQLGDAIVAGELLTQLSYADFRSTQIEWQHVKDRSGISLSATDESVEWDWPRKFSERQPEHRFIGIRAEGKLQGLMQVHLNWRAEDQTGNTREHVVYLEHLETAPWNLERYVGKSNRVYTRIGTQLIVAAGEMSAAEGLLGRLGLHSLPLSEGFYGGFEILKRRVFEDLGHGYLPYPSLRYFETYRDEKDEEER